MNKDQRIISIKEQKNQVIAQKDIIEHSNAVLDFLVNDAKERITEKEAQLQNLKAGSDKDKAREVVKVVRQALAQLESQKRQNEQELIRLTLNCDLFDKQVEALSA